MIVAIGGQALIVASIFGVTGISPTEAQAIHSRGTRGVVLKLRR